MMRSGLVMLLLFAAALLTQPTTTRAVAQSVEAEASESGGCCPNYNIHVDCFAEGHWHINHCKHSCIDLD